MIQPLHATILGILEGLTEFLPVSSTGHLILAGHLMHLDDEAAKTFEIVIQAGALGAVLGLYRTRVVSMWQALWGRDDAGRRVLLNLLLSFLPAAVVGVLLHHSIKRRLFQTWPVVIALAVGGGFMVATNRWLLQRVRASTRTLDSVKWSEALLIGGAQCLALWPGTSRSMVTLVAGLLLGLPATVAAEYSFLLALPTLGAATVFDAASGGRVLLQGASVFSIACGFIAAAVVAALAIRGFIQYLTRHGLALFGWYRLGLAAVVWGVARLHP